MFSNVIEMYSNTIEKRFIIKSFSAHFLSFIDALFNVFSALKP